MQTIEERAKEYAYYFRDPFKVIAQKFYTLGATDQRDIDIQRAREIRCNLCAGLCKGNAACGDLKEITKYMKGE